MASDFRWAIYARLAWRPDEQWHLWGDTHYSRAAALKYWGEFWAHSGKRWRWGSMRRRGLVCCVRVKVEVCCGYTLPTASPESETSPDE